jgi:hypothetical protein
MREKDFNTGLRGVLFEARHYARMGAAVWLYGWLVLRQTHESAGIGYVLGGAPITYREIQEETGFNRRTLEAWMRVLRREGYIQTDTLPGGISIHILKAKKHRPHANAKAASHGPESATVRRPPSPQRGLRGFAEPARGIAEWHPQSSVASSPEFLANQQVAAPIDSSSLGRIKENPTPDIHRRVENRVCANPEQTQTDLRWKCFRHESTADPNPSDIEQTEAHGWDPGEDQRFGQPHSLSSQARDYSHSHTHAKERRPTEICGPSRTIQEKFPWELRKRMQLLRAEREEETRRELYVGTGPEGRRR